MSRHYEFIRKATGRPVSLETVEKDMVAILDPDYTIDKDRYHPVWDTFILWAFGRLMKHGGCQLEPHMWSFIAQEMADAQEDSMNAVRVRAMVLYLQATYHFNAWG